MQSYRLLVVHKITAYLLKYNLYTYEDVNMVFYDLYIWYIGLKYIWYQKPL